MSILSGKKLKKTRLEGFLQNPLFYFLWQKPFSLIKMVFVSPAASSQRTGGGEKHKPSNFTKIKIFFRKIAQVLSKQKERRHLNGGGFYFGFIPLVLLGLLFLGSGSLAKLGDSKNNDALFFSYFFKNNNNPENNDLFFSQNKILALETPDLIIQDSFIYGVSTPRVLTTQTLGAIFGELNGNKSVNNYYVEPGDTIESIAENFNISINTLLWANNLSKNSTLKVGQTLVILPVSGLVHIVKSGDTISEISKTYKSKVDDIIAFNDLTSEGDIFIGDILIVPGGTMPSKTAPSIIQAPLADNFFIYPSEGKISQSLHWYNAVDIANNCGTPIYAAASGTVQRVRYGWNAGGGNQITILHSNGIVTYYGHLMTIFVKTGDRVNVGERIALMGGANGMAGAGISTGCHLHFGVTAAKNPFAKYSRGTIIKYKQ